MKNPTDKEATVENTIKDKVAAPQAPPKTVLTGTYIHIYIYITNTI